MPGPAGANGAPGANGTNGINAYTTVTQQFTVPAVNDTVDVLIVNGSFLSVGQPIWIGNAGAYRVVSIASSTQINVRNLGGATNAVEGDPIPVGSKVSPGAEGGAAGAAGAAGVNDFIKVTNRAALKTMNTPAAPLHPVVVRIISPEPGVSRWYVSSYGNTTAGDDEEVIQPNDGLCRYFADHGG